MCLKGFTVGNIIQQSNPKNCGKTCLHPFQPGNHLHFLSEEVILQRGR